MVRVIEFLSQQTLSDFIKSRLYVAFYLTIESNKYVPSNSSDVHLEGSGDRCYIFKATVGGVGVFEKNCGDLS